ncbi:terminase small subunit [Marinibaculum pumilum]|uniref:Terminase small subunit n=1 Tax=Marinibaculum pumilum TaxID=1766165 RepID=A0ABV7KYH5_9PROT
MTPKQKRFVASYLVTGNATQAAIDAGYSEKTAARIGSENLRKPVIASEIAEAEARRAERVEINADQVVLELRRIGMSDPRALFDADGRLLPVKDWPDDIARAVSSFEVVTKRIPGTDPVEVEHVAKVRFWPKTDALGLLGKHLGMFVNRHELTGKGGGPIETKRAELTPEELRAELERRGLPTEIFDR